MLSGKRRAIIVGINEYEDGRISSLTGAENDAKEISNRLKNPEIGNFEIRDEHVLIGKKATCTQIRKAISDLFWKTDSCDIALFYFSGHGFEDTYNDGYIAPYDISKAEPFVCGINMEQLKQVISRSVSTCAIIILDCCHSGIATEPDKSVDDVAQTIVKHYQEFPGKGRIILASSEGDQTSKEITGHKHWSRNDCLDPHPHGTFSFYLIEGIDGKATEDEKGIITLGKLFEYAADETERQGKQKPICCAAEAGPLERIEIAIATERHNQYLKGKIEAANNYYNQRDICSLITAATELSEVFKINAKHVEATGLKNKINDDLADWERNLKDWLTNNQFKVRSSIPTAYLELRQLLSSLCFDTIIKLDKNKQELLIILYDVVKGNVKYNDFIDEIKKRTVSQQQQTGLSIN